MVTPFNPNIIDPKSSIWSGSNSIAHGSARSSQVIQNYRHMQTNPKGYTNYNHTKPLKDGNLAQISFKGFLNSKNINIVKLLDLEFVKFTPDKALEKLLELKPLDAADNLFKFSKAEAIKKSNSDKLLM